MWDRNTTMNARVAAICFPAGAIGIHILSQIENSLLPLRLISIGVLIFGAWAFCDEMGLRKPLNRAGFISFLFSMGALLVIVLTPAQSSPQFFLIYAFGLLLSLLIWSGAFLHRQKMLKVVGTVGALASALPIIILTGAHLSLGFGAFFGTSLLFSLSAGDSMLGSTPLNIIEAVFLGWTLIASVFLATGQIHDKAALVNCSSSNAQ